MRLLRNLFLFICLTLFRDVVSGQSADAYNIRWDTPSANASASMPVGGGDIGMNVWVENGDVLIYVARSGSFDENNALLKTGRIRITLTPNVFDGGQFLQELHLQEGYILLTGERNRTRVELKIWADVWQPVARFSISSNKKVSVSASYESWRYRDRILQSRENFGNSFKWEAPKDNVGKKDSIRFDRDRVVFYHHNQSPNIFDLTVEQQGLDSVKDQLYNPLRNLCFGGSFEGRGFVKDRTIDGKYVNTDFRGWKLRSSTAARSHALALYLHQAQISSPATWRSSLDSLVAKHRSRFKASAKDAANWWNAFWKRSYIHTSSVNDTTLWQVVRNARLFRYMLGCNAKGIWPTKFNGGLFTVDPVYTNPAHELTPDYRNWGGGLHTAQNQRLVHFPMIRNGDWDLLQPQLDFYTRLLKNAELRSNVYWRHNGASFTEQMENFGLPNYAEYGVKRPKDFDKGVEYNAWLEYQWDTVLEFCLMMLERQRYTGSDISAYLPFIESCLRFFDEHYTWLAKQRGRKSLDEQGKLILYPGSAAETYKMAYNASSTIVALQVLTDRLLALPNGSLSDDQRRYWQGFRSRIPEILYTTSYGKVTIAPAIHWERINNVETPQLYPVYPWGVFGLGKPGLDTALNTWKLDTNAIRFRSHVGWKQDNIWAARLGLTDEAWKLTSLKLRNAERRFPAFWGPGYDWVPDHNWGGSGLIGLQEMLMQTDDKVIRLFPAWPKDKDIQFKLHAPYGTVVEASLKNGQLESLHVTPASRKADVIVML